MDTKVDDFDQLIALLDWPDDYFWGDVLSGEAREIIDKNVDGILSRVLDCWGQWPENRLEHLAFLLGESDSEIEKKLIYDLHYSQYKSVVSRAKEAFDELKPRI